MPVKVFNAIKLKSLPFHPFLVVSFQILAIYAVNVNIVKISSAMSVLLVAFVFTTLSLLFLSFITKDIKRSAIVVSFYIFLFFTYGRLFEIMPGLQIVGMVIGRNKYLLIFYALALIAGTLLILRSKNIKRNSEEITYILNMLSLTLVIVSVLVAISNFERIVVKSDGHTVFKSDDIIKKVKQVSQIRKNVSKPNVYFIILDSYASHRTLKKYYDWDDSGVVEAFRRRGFSVNKKAYSNYPFTGLSLGATLNMRYVHEDREFIDAKSKISYLAKIKDQNEVIQRFKSEGYDIISDEFEDYKLLYKKRSIDKNKISSWLSDEFIDMVIRVSILCIMQEELTVDARRQDILSDFEALKRMDIANKPKFVFTHILCPHPPYIFKVDGSKPGLLESAWGRVENKNGYISQLRFVGTQIIEVVDILRIRDPSAVIIVQADHGHGYILGDYLLDSKKPPIEFIDAQYGIFSAIYLPPGIVIPEKIVPVNLFRYIFNALFNAKLDILPERTFFTKIKEPFAIYEVTSDLNRLNNQ